MTDRGSPPILSYVPQVYRHRQTRTAGWAAFAALAAVVVGIMDWRGQGPPFWVQGLIVGTPALFTACAYWFGWAAECRVEGEQLWFSAENVPPTSVEVVNLIAIDQVETEDGYYFEITVRDKGRMKVGPDIFRPIEPLRRVLSAINPGIRFGQRSATDCGWCGATLFPTDRTPGVREVIRTMSSGHCPSCKKPFPKFGRFL